MDAARALQAGRAAVASRAPGSLHRALRRLRHHKAKDLPAVMLERFGDVDGYVGRPGRGGGVAGRSLRESREGGRLSIRHRSISHTDARVTPIRETTLSRRYSGDLRYSRLARLASSRSRSRSIRRRISSVILPSRSSDVDEFPLRRDQFPRQADSGRRNVVGVGIERVRQLVDAGLVPGAQQLDHLVGQFAVVGDGFERRKAAPSASRRAAISDSISATCSARPRVGTPSQRTTGGSPSPTRPG